MHRFVLEYESARQARRVTLPVSLGVALFLGLMIFLRNSSDHHHASESFFLVIMVGSLLFGGVVEWPAPDSLSR